MRLPFFIVAAIMSVLVSGCVSLPGLSTQSEPDQTESVSEAPPPSEQPPADPSAPPVVLILDSSGSMREADLGGDLSRMDAAREAAKRFAAGLPEDTPIGLVAYGDRTPEDAPVEEGCTDVSVKVPLGPRSDAFNTAVDALTPVGWSPIGAALTQSVDLLPEGPAYLILVSDGEDTCTPPEPCEATRQLVSGHPGLVVSTIGLRASSAQLSCIADAGNGVHVTADNADQLQRRLEALSNPNKAAQQLSPQGANGISPGQKLSAIRERYADFPAVTFVPGQNVEVIWRDCRWVFNDQEVLQSIAVDGGSTIDGLFVGDPASALTVLGKPVATESEGAAQVRYYVANQAAKLAWRIYVEGDRITRIVLCTCLPEPPVTLENAVLDTSGLGPIKLGMSLAELRRRGWVEQEPHCGHWGSTQTLRSRGVHLEVFGGEVLSIVTLATPHYATRSGARVGMTYGQLKQIYGDDIQVVTKQGNGGPFQVAMVRSGNREVVFLRAWETPPFTANTRIELIHARPYDEGFFGGC